MTSELLSEITGAPDIQPVPPTTPDAPMVTIRMRRLIPEHEAGFEFPEGNLDYGPSAIHAPEHAARNIKFNIGGDGHGYAHVPSDHPMIDSLLRSYPQAEIVETGPRDVTYLCEDCDAEYSSKRGLVSHKRSHSR